MLGNFLEKIRQKAEELFWPTFGKRGLPKTVKAQLERLPKSIELEYLEVYKSSIKKHRHGRDASIVVLVLLLLNNQFWAALIIVLYWLQIRHKKIPRVAQNVLENIQKRYKIRASADLTPPSERKSYESAEVPNRHRMRKLHENYDPSNLSVENLKEGYMVDYNLKTWQVSTRYQFDWEKGVSAREIKLVSDTESLWVYLSKEGAFLSVAVSKPTNIYALDPELETEIYHHKRPPNILDYQDLKYFRENSLSGYVFNLTTDSIGTKVSAWEYLDQKREHYLRIEQREQKNFRVLLGKIASPYTFSDILPPAK